MKLKHEKIEEEVRSTLKLLNEMGPFEAHHLFRAKLMRRIETDLKQNNGGALLGRPDFRLACMIMLLLFNLASAFVSMQQESSQSMTTAGQLAGTQSDYYSAQEFAYYDQTTSYDHKSP